MGGMHRWDLFRAVGGRRMCGAMALVAAGAFVQGNAFAQPTLCGPVTYDVGSNAIRWSGELHMRASASCGGLAGFECFEERRIDYDLDCLPLDCPNEHVFGHQCGGYDDFLIHPTNQVIARCDCGWGEAYGKVEAAMATGQVNATFNSISTSIFVGGSTVAEACIKECELGRHAGGASSIGIGAPVTATVNFNVEAPGAVVQFSAILSLIHESGGFAEADVLLNGQSIIDPLVDFSVHAPGGLVSDFSTFFIGPGNGHTLVVKLRGSMDANAEADCAGNPCEQAGIPGGAGEIILDVGLGFLAP